MACVTNYLDWGLSPVYTRPLTRILIQNKVTRVSTCKWGFGAVSMRAIGYMYMPVISPARAANMATHAWIKLYTETLVWDSLRLTPITIISRHFTITVCDNYHHCLECICSHLGNSSQHWKCAINKYLPTLTVTNLKCGLQMACKQPRTWTVPSSLLPLISVTLLYHNLPEMTA